MTCHVEMTLWGLDEATVGAGIRGEWSTYSEVPPSVVELSDAHYWEGRTTPGYTVLARDPSRCVDHIEWTYSGIGIEYAPLNCLVVWQHGLREPARQAGPFFVRNHWPRDFEVGSSAVICLAADAWRADLRATAYDRDDVEVGSASVEIEIEDYPLGLAPSSFPTDLYVHRDWIGVWTLDHGGFDREIVDHGELPAGFELSHGQGSGELDSEVGFSWTPEPDQVGRWVIPVSVHDDEGNGFSTELELQVHPGCMAGTPSSTGVLVPLVPIWARRRRRKT